MVSSLRSLSMTVRIFISMVLGVLAGLALGPVAAHLNFLGEIYLRLLKFCVMPIVLLASISAICNTDIKTLGRLGLFSFLLFMALQACAGLFGGAAGIWFSRIGGIAPLRVGAEHLVMPKIESWQNIVIQFFPDNLIRVLLEGNVFVVMIMGTLCGVAIAKMGTNGKRLSENVKLWNDMVQKLVSIIFSFTPVGVFALIASSAGQYGMAALKPLLNVIVVFYACCAFWLTCVYMPLMWFSAGVSPLRFIKKCLPLIFCCIGTCSSMGVIPVTLETAHNRFRVSPVIANFVIPLGAQVNKNGTGLLYPCVYAFACQALGSPASLSGILAVVLLTVAINLSGGTGGIPAGGLLIMAMIFSAMDMPMEFIVMLGGVYRIIDMGTTTMNCLGDLVVAVMLDSLDKKGRLFSLQDA